MPFAVSFDDPDMPELHVAAPVLHERYYMAPNPNVGSSMPWLLVGFAPGAEPLEPWPGQRVFEFEPEHSTVQLSDAGQPIGGVAIYREVVQD